jgi:hypothetical protein
MTNNNDVKLAGFIQEIHRLDSRLDYLMREGSNDDLFRQIYLLEKVCEDTLYRLNDLKFRRGQT